MDIKIKKEFEEACKVLVSQSMWIYDDTLKEKIVELLMACFEAGYATAKKESFDESEKQRS